MSIHSCVKRWLGRAGEAARPGMRRWARPGYFDVPFPPPSPSRAAVVACHWLGDSLWAAQALAALRERWPGTEWTVFAKAFTRPLWRGLVPSENFVAADAVVSDRRRERASWRAIRTLARERRADLFDGVVDLTGNRYSAAFSFWLRPGWTLGFDGGELGALYSRRVAGAERPGRHLAERPWRVIEPILGRFAFPPDGRLRPPEGEGSYAEAVAALGLDPARGVGVVAPGAGWAAKRRPPEWFAEAVATAAATLTADRANPAPTASAIPQWVVTGSAREQALCEAAAEAIRTRTEGRVAPALATANLPLGRVFALLSGCRAMLANDSGLGHVAAAYGRRTASVFTGATSAASYAPLGEKARAFGPEATAEAVGGYLRT